MSIYLLLSKWGWMVVRCAVLAREGYRIESGSGSTEKVRSKLIGALRVVVADQGAFIILSHRIR